MRLKNPVVVVIWFAVAITKFINADDLFVDDTFAAYHTKDQSWIKNSNQENKVLANEDAVANELQTFAQEPVRNSYTMCDICYCPEDESQVPYIINCKALLLKEIPTWSDRLTAEDPAVNSVHLELDYNSIAIISLINTCQVIDGISFGFNRVVGIEPFAFAELPNLKRLCLSNNEIESIHPSAFQMSDDQYSPVEVLDLSNNNLSHLDSDIFEKLANLLELNLGGNPFGFLDPSTISNLHSLPALRYLNMATTGLSELPLTMVDVVQHLERLDIAHNNFMEVPEVIQHGRQLIELTVSDNPLTELQASSFIELQSLQVLHVSNMPSLKTIYKGTFYPMKSLLTLKCNNNPHLEMIEIGSFWDQYGDGPMDLETLELRGNNLTTFERELLGYLEIQDLDIRGNPLDCSCQLAWLKTVKAAHNYLNETICWSPPELNGRSIADVDLACSDAFLNDGMSENEINKSSKYTVMNYFLAITFLTCLALLVAILIFLLRNKKTVPYKNLTLISATKSKYNGNFGQLSNLQYMRQFDEDI